MGRLRRIGRAVLGDALANCVSRHLLSVRSECEAIRWRRTADGRRNVARMQALRGAYSGQRCFIIGNGPSLRDTDLRALSGEVTIGSNGLYLLFDSMGYAPTYFTVEDRLVAESRGNEIAKVRGTTKIVPRDLCDCVPPDDQTINIDFRRVCHRVGGFSRRLDRVAYWGGTVTYLNLQLACHIGCTEAYLVGVDHNYSPELTTRPVIDGVERSRDHFAEDYLRGQRAHAPNIERMEAAYRAARAGANRYGMRICNATLGGKLEVFPRVNYDDVVKECE